MRRQTFDLSPNHRFTNWRLTQTVQVGKQADSVIARVPKQTLDYRDLTCVGKISPQEEGRTEGGGGMGIGCAGRRRGRRGDEIEPSTAPQTLAIDGYTTQPEQKMTSKPSSKKNILTCSLSLASSTMAFSSSNSRQPTPSRRSRSSQPRHRMQTPFRIIGAFRCS